MSGKKRKNKKSMLNSPGHDVDAGGNANDYHEEEKKKKSKKGEMEKKKTNASGVSSPRASG